MFHKIRENMKNLWFYNKEDKSLEKPTWKYLAHRYVKKCVVWCQNPYFAYKHLSPFDKNSLPLEEFKNIQ